jgi:hypothetical protein
MRTDAGADGRPLEHRGPLTGPVPQVPRRRVGAPASRERQRQRQAIGRTLGELHAGVVRRADLIASGLTDHDIRSEVQRGVWQQVGKHTLCVTGPEPKDEGLLWYALWESGPRSVLDGPSALIAAGLKHWREGIVHVSVPGNANVRTLAFVRHHKLRDIGPSIDTGLRRTKAPVAAVRAAQWARTDREAAALLAMAVQQRLVSTQQLLERWGSIRTSRRRRFLDAVIRDVCDGAQSINELDVAAACRARGLPGPTRQAVRTSASGRVYLDLLWEEEGVHAEVQGAQHYAGLAVVDDSVRVNDLAITHVGQISLQIPVLGWRLDPDRFLDQIEAALEEGRRRRQSGAA